MSGHVGLVYALAEPALETIGVEETHEQLEVRVLAVVRRCRHQQKIASSSAEQFAELVALGLLYLAAEVRGRHAMSFVADNQVPIGRRLELRLQLVRSGGHVETDDQAVAFNERVARERRLDLIARQDVEREAEFFGHLVLPLLHETARRDDEAAFEVATDQ